MKKSFMVITVVLLAAQWAAGAIGNLLEKPGFEHGLAPWLATGTAQAILRADWQAHSSRWSFGVGNDGGPDEAYGRGSQDIELSEPFLLRGNYAPSASMSWQKNTIAGSLP